MRYKNKKGQVEGILTFTVIVLTLLFLAPILFKITLTPLDKFTTSMMTVDSTNKSIESSSFIRGKFTGMMDWVIMAIFIFSIALLLISSFLIDIHPAFFVIYLIASFCIIAFAPSVMTSLDFFYGNAGTTASSNFVLDENGVNFVEEYLPMTNWAYNNFGLIITGIFILSGAIMYGKYKFSSNSQPAGVNY